MTAEDLDDPAASRPRRAAPSLRGPAPRRCPKSVISRPTAGLWQPPRCCGSSEWRAPVPASPARRAARLNR